jgi:hypothetical protein
MCGIPAVGIRGHLSSEDARELADAFRAENRRLWLVGASGESLSLSGALPSLGVRSAIGERLRPTLTHRPDSLVPQEASFVAGEVGNASAPSDFHGPEFRSDAAPWRWLGSHPWLTVVSDGPTWLGFRAVSYRRPRTLTLRTPSGTVLSAGVTTRPRTLLLGPLDLHTREELEITTTPSREAGPPGDRRSLSVSITDPVVVNQPLAAVGVSGFWPAERDPSGRPFNWIKPRATVQIVATRETEQARLVIEASAPGGPLTLGVRATGAEIARLRLKPGFHRYVVDHVPLSQGRAVIDLIHSPTRDQVLGRDPRKVAVMVSKLEAASVSDR